MRKKILALGLTFVMALSLFGCGGGDKDAAAPADDAAVADDAAAEETTEAPKDDAAKEDASGTETAADTSDLKDWEKEYAKTYDISGDEEYVWGYVAQSFTDTFCSRVQKAMEDYTKQNFPNVTLNVGDGKQEVNTHIELAENFITQGVDCLIVTASDSNGEVVICDMAKEAGIPFVVVNSDIACDPIDHWFVGSDHYVSGHLQGEYVRDNIDDSETVNICYLGGTDGFTHTTLRRQGFYDALDEANYNYKVLADLEGEYLRDRGMEITEDWLIQYGDDIDVIVAANDEMGMGALNAIQGAGMSDIIVCGIDANDDAKEAVKAGTFGCTVFQAAEGQGKWGAIAAYAASQGKDFTTLDIPYELVTADNVDQY
ncbi:substrate-binding domain-containing protein [Ruminococcus gauvreauii]|uniref:substrate-binding domain-containing protein n=1 Tax=Ruminococcus gauvreauii TaxID=438033 RepID=UPI003983E63D